MYYIINWPRPIGLENIIRTSEPVIPDDAQYQPDDILKFSKLVDAKNEIYEYYKNPQVEIIVKL